ncbi:MAG: hypothetical protein HOL16_00265 [Alphaproteobacteria bacterium]|nr:hypothetical protein [Alphaproteobacteria bacterium]
MLSSPREDGDSGILAVQGTQPKSVIPAIRNYGQAVGASLEFLMSAGSRSFMDKVSCRRKKRGAATEAHSSLPTYSPISPQNPTQTPISPNNVEAP